MKNAREFVNYQRAISARKLIILAESGSRLLGLSQDENSDVDEMGIVLETPEDLLGFEPFESDVYRTAVDRTGNFDARSEAGDIDLVLYGLRKFVRMALSGNPNVIAMLYVPSDKCSIYTPLAKDLQGIAPCFISKRVLEAFRGYLQAQRLRLMGLKGGMRVNRDIGAVGYDTKYAMHACRLGIQGLFYAQKGYLTFPLEPEYIEFLTNVRSGVYNYDTIIDKLDTYERQLEDHLHASAFPEAPAYDVISSWLVKSYKREWYESPEG